MLQAKFARSDDIGVVLLSDVLVETDLACRPEPSSPECDLESAPAADGSGRCIGDIGQPPEQVFTRCALCAMLWNQAQMPLQFVAYRQSRADENSESGDYHQITPLLEGPWCDVAGGNRAGYGKRLDSGFGG
ncbi:MAG: hypothetical protein GY703_24455 [Gammaproteobacteria bacterium]|nr:hypothetical protein [Gammaproteobacteria bacterium]